MGVKVTAAYVTVRVPNLAGQEVLGEFFQDAVLPEKANREDVERLLRKGMAVEVDETAAQPEPKAPVLTFDEDGKPVRPDNNANKPFWVEYAVALRGEEVDEATARAAAEATSKADLIKQFG